MELYVDNDINDIIYNTFFYATMCHVCKRFGDGVHLKRCSACRMISYCGKEHQKLHWPQHKSLCKAIRDVLRDHSMENHGVTSEEWAGMKLNLMLLVSCKLGRRLKVYEMEMFKFPRECAVCYKRDGLEDCQNCMAVSFCKDHKDSINHEDICSSLRLCLHLNLFAISKEDQHLDMHYLEHVTNMDKDDYNYRIVNIFQDMDDFINIYFGNIGTYSEMSYKIWAVNHSQYLTRPLTLFHAMRILNYVPKHESLVIHVIAASFIEEVTVVAWEVLLHLISTVKSLVVIMIGPELKYKTYPLHICNNCMKQEKEFLLEFHNVLYENYMYSPSFVKPDLVIGFNAGIQQQELPSPADTWAPSIQVLAKQDCPFILTCYMQEETEMEIDRINTILDRKVEYFYSGKNPFAGLRPYRVLSPEHLFYQNHYLIIYKSLCN